MDKDYHHCDYLGIQERLNAAMPMVGFYIAAASAVCTLAMAADAFFAFRRKKLWFPSKYFSLNAASLTLLAVATKLTVDINTPSLFYFEKDGGFAKLIGTFFMSTALANFILSLGSMTDKEILANVIALGILVFTITGNLAIQLIQLRDFLGLSAAVVYGVPTIVMVILFVTLVSSAITLPTMKRNLESKYQEKHIVALREEEVFERREAFRIDHQRGKMMKYWMMAETSSPQFVMARSVVCTTSSVMCLFSALILLVIHVVFDLSAQGDCTYGDYTKWTVYVQSVGVGVGTIGPVLRWFVAVALRSWMTDLNNFKKGFKIEAHWTQTLADWRDSFSALQIRQNKCRKYLHDVKWFALTFCIGFQILIVVVSKLIASLSALLVIPIFLCHNHFKKQSGGEGDIDLNLNSYVLLLEGDPELPRRVLKSICREADNITEKGRKKQPQSLVSLLRKSVNFNGVGEFDSNQIPSLHSQEPTNCWALPVVTLTSIAIALPNIAKHERNQLLISVSEGLSLAKIVENTLVKNAQLVNNIRNSADICWVGVLLYMKWLDIDLKRMSLKCKNSMAVLQELLDKAEGIIMEFKKEAQDPVMENPLNWPSKVVIANSMYRISRTTLLSCEEENALTDEELFERLSVMIADILAACLTNLPHAITTMCHHRAIEKRGESVREAFLLLGKTEKVVEVVHQIEWPSLDHDKAARIQEWRALSRHF